MRPFHCLTAGLLGLRKFSGQKTAQAVLLEACGIRRLSDPSDTQGTLHAPTPALMRLGAGRPQAPRSAVSAMLAVLSMAAVCAGHGAGCDPCVCPCHLPTPPSVMTLEHLDGVAHLVRPVLQLVLGPCATAMRAEQQSGSIVADAAGRVLSRMASPADLAAALAASFTALYGILSPRLHKMPGFEGPMCGMKVEWVRLFADSADIVSGLSAWLLGAAGSGGCGWDGSMATGGGSSSSGGSGSSSGGSSSRSGGSGSSPWGAEHERWRAALQEFGVLNAVCRVRAHPPHALHICLHVPRLMMLPAQPPSA